MSKTRDRADAWMSEWIYGVENFHADKGKAGWDRPVKLSSMKHDHPITTIR